MRDKEFEKFNIARDYYNSVRRARAGLEKNLDGALCVMGQRGEGRLSDAEISILLADSLLTGSGIYPINERYTFYFSAAAVFLAVIVMCSFAPLLSCILSIGFSAVVFLVFAQVFVKSGFWLDPLVPSAAVLTGGITSAFLALIIRLDGGRLSLFDITASMPRAYIKSMFTHDIRQNKRASAAIAAVRIPDFAAFEKNESAEQAARRLRQFHDEARTLFIKAGAVLAGAENGLLIFAFGSPLEILAGKKKRGKKAAKETPIRNAACFLAKIDFSKIKTSPWYIGLDAGECVFCAFDTSGYHVSGSPAARARMLSSLAGSHNAQILLPASAAEQLAPACLRKIDAGTEVYYELKTTR
jgi:hypothetical protein